MTRRQLSLYLPPAVGGAIDRVRQVLDPVQHALIPAHVTLCREDELATVADVRLAARLSAPEARRLTLRFGAAETFDGHGILLPCIDGEPAFAALRRHVLGEEPVRHAAPHLTLAHPRNPRAEGNALETAAEIPVPLEVTFDAVRLIEQVDGGPWRQVRRWTLAV